MGFISAFGDFAKLSHRACDLEGCRVEIHVDMLSAEESLDDSILVYDVSIFGQHFDAESAGGKTFFEEVDLFIQVSKLGFRFLCLTESSARTLNFRPRKIDGISILCMCVTSMYKVVKEVLDASDLRITGLKLKDIAPRKAAVFFPKNTDASLPQVMLLYLALCQAVPYSPFCPQMSASFIEVVSSAATGHKNTCASYIVHGDVNRFHRLQLLRAYMMQSKNFLQGVVYIINQMLGLIREKILSKFSVHILWIYFLVHEKRSLCFISPLSLRQDSVGMGIHVNQTEQKIILKESDDLFIGSLITDFFTFYAQIFDFSKQVVTLREVNGITYNRKSDENFLMCIEDPVSGENITKHVDREAFERIQGCMTQWLQNKSLR